MHGVTRSAGLRWHQGQIERVYNAPDGRKLYEGRHTKGKADGKWITYKVTFNPLTKGAYYLRFKYFPWDAELKTKMRTSMQYQHIF